MINKAANSISKWRVSWKNINPKIGIINIGTENNMVVLTAKGKNLESTFNFISLIFGTISSLVLIIIFYQIDIIILLFGYIINSLSLGYLVGKQFYSQYAKYLLLQKILTVGLGLSFFYLFGADGIISALGISYIGFIIIIVKLHKILIFYLK